MELGNLVGAAINMFSPTRPRSISGTSSATDQLRVRFPFISNIGLDTTRSEELRPVCKLFVTQFCYTPSNGSTRDLLLRREERRRGHRGIAPPEVGLDGRLLLQASEV